MERDSGIELKDFQADGGAVANAFLMQFQADILGVSVEVPEITETTAVGSAYMAGLATGFWESKEEVAETWRLQRRYDPQMSEQERDRLHGLWLKAVERAKGWEGRGPGSRGLREGSEDRGAQAPVPPNRAHEEAHQRAREGRRGHAQGDGACPRRPDPGHPESNVVVRADAPVEGKVALVSGGGSGHEPTHGGFVGPGMLDAACAGAVFHEPTPDQMFEASKAVDGGAGVFYVVKNYTGDVLNFEMAGELGEAEGIETDYVVTNDDVAVEDSTYTSGRRGIAGTHLRAQDLRRSGRRRERSRRHKGACRTRQLQRAFHGDGANELHPAREWGAHLRHRRG